MCWLTTNESCWCWGGVIVSTSMSDGVTTSIISCYKAACGPRIANTASFYCVTQHFTTDFYVIVSFHLTIWIPWGCTYVIVSTMNLKLQNCFKTVLKLLQELAKILTVNIRIWKGSDVYFLHYTIFHFSVFFFRIPSLFPPWFII
jgi:hypothetical protein